MMDKGREDIVRYFGERLRIRVNGICIEDNRLLMINHRSVGALDHFWSPPGGGMEFGTSAEENLIREFYEETGLKVNVGRLLFVHEFLNVPLHAIELFFSVVKIQGILKMGQDPELSPDQQIISEVKWMNMDEIRKLGKENKHQMFELCHDLEDLLNLKGYFKL